MTMFVHNIDGDHSECVICHPTWPKWEASAPSFPEPPDVPPYLPDGTANPAWPPSYRDIAAKATWLAYRARTRVP